MGIKTSQIPLKTNYQPLKRSSANALRHALVLSSRVFVIEMVAVSTFAFFMGYELTQLIFELVDLWQQPKVQKSVLCPICGQVPFQLVSADCKHIVSCEDCFPKLKDTCRVCKGTIRTTIKIYF